MLFRAGEIEIAYPAFGVGNDVVVDVFSAGFPVRGRRWAAGHSFAAVCGMKRFAG